MKWSLSEFLNLIELRSQCWCLIDLAEGSGLRVPHNEAIVFHLLLSGTARITGVRGGDIDLGPGDIAMILSGDAHTLRNQPGGKTVALDFLTNGEPADVPPTFTLGHGRTMTQLLCGRLKVRWPGGQHPRSVPPVLNAKSSAGVFNMQAAIGATKGSGATAILTRIATALFVSSFRDHPDCVALFRYPDINNPISHALQFIQRHPFSEWTVESLAKKVGMGRSNFAARFVAEVGRTPMEVLIEERMKHAATFLQQSDLKVTEISARVGYRSEAAFNRRFTSYFGMTPGKMRRRSRQQEEEQTPA